MINFLALGALVSCAWSTGGLLEPTSRSVTARVTTTGSPVIASDATVGRDILEPRRAPVPLVRNVRPPDVPSTSVETPSSDQKGRDEEKAQDDLARKAAQTAVEADGYKRVTLVGKTSSGSWRAKAYRGTTEVWVTVDGTGRVSME